MALERHAAMARRSGYLLARFPILREQVTCLPARHCGRYQPWASQHCGAHMLIDAQETRLSAALWSHDWETRAFLRRQGRAAAVQVLRSRQSP